MERQADVLVIGGCTAGLFFAARMAEQGFNVLVADKSPEDDLGRRYDIIHIGAEHFEAFGLPRPIEGDEDYVTEFTYNISKSALDRWPKGSRNHVLVLRRALFIKRLVRRAREKGVNIQFETEFQKLLFNEKGQIEGAVVRSGGNETIIRARLVADCSGIPAVVRTRLPENYGVENFVTDERSQFFVVLHYVMLKDESLKIVPAGWPYYKTWIAPQHVPGGAIIGIGANLSFDYAERCYKRFTGSIALPPNELKYTEKSSTPYRRPPYSFVADGFVVLGDASCITNPWSGEGVPYAWKLCAIAAEEFGRVMKDGSYPLKEQTWNVNKRYIDEQGAQFAMFLSMLSGFLDCSAEENDYEFEKSIVFQDDEEKQDGNMMGKIFKGVFTGRISVRSVLKILGAASIGKRVLDHYKAYPPTPRDFEAWAKKAEGLWNRAGSMADLALKEINREEKTNAKTNH